MTKYRSPQRVMTFGVYLSLFFRCPLTLWHSCCGACRLDNQSNGPRSKPPHWCRASRLSRGRNYGGLAYWDDSVGNNHSANQRSHPPKITQPCLIKKHYIIQWDRVTFCKNLYNNPNISYLLWGEADDGSVGRSAAGDISGVQCLFGFAFGILARWR